MKTEKLLNKYKKLWINVGASYYVLENYVNLDNSLFLLFSFFPFYPLIKFVLKRKHREWVEKWREARKRVVIVRCNCRRRLPFANESVDQILCSHFLEHVYPDEAVLILKDFFRVLKKDGVLHIFVPDLAMYINDYIQHKQGNVSADAFMQATSLSSGTPPNLLFRFLEIIGRYGLKHLWMYDEASLTQRFLDVGFRVIPKNEIPSLAFKGNGIHIAARKK